MFFVVKVINMNKSLTWFDCNNRNHAVDKSDPSTRNFAQIRLDLNLKLYIWPMCVSQSQCAGLV